MKNCMLFLLMICFSACAQKKSDHKVVITMETLLNEMTDRGSLAEWPIVEYTTKQVSSYSRASKDKTNLEADAQYKTGNFGDPNVPRDWGQGWFENHDFDHYIRSEINQGRKEEVMFEDFGAGAVVRFWATFGDLANNPGGIYRVYIDDNPEPVIAMKNTELIGESGLVGKPFSYFAPEKAENDLWRGRNFILPIPYSRSCKITFDGESNYGHLDQWKGHYYQINYRSYETGTKVESFDSTTLERYKNQIVIYGKKLTEDPVIADQVLSKTNTTLEAGKSIKLRLSGTQAINQIVTKLKAANQEQALRSTVLKIAFDGNTTVWSPVGQFYGVGYKQLAHHTYYIHTGEDGQMKAFWVMPFSQNAEVSLINYDDQPVIIEKFQVAHTDYQWSDNSMYFHATWKETRGLNTELRTDFNYITVKGKGVFVGDNLTLFNSFPDTTGINWWGEGDEKIYIDGEPFPSHFGTGTEDYYCYAWCRPQAFSAPNASQPIGNGNKTPGITSNNRYRLLDAIPFTTKFNFDMEIWHPFRAAMNYSPATFFYAFSGAEWNPKEDIEGVQQKVALKIEDVPLK